MSVGESQTTFDYTGEMVDGTGLVFLRARFYDPATGRFFARDPFAGFLIQPASQNGYSYALNNPILYTDPSGKVVPVILVAAGIGLVAGAGFDLAVQLINNGGNLKCVRWGEVAISAGAGAVASLAGVYVITPIIEAIGYGTFIAGGALISGAINAVNQYRETGSVDVEEVFNSAFHGAVIAGGIGIASVGLSVISSGIASAIIGGVDAAKTSNNVPIVGQPQSTLDPFHSALSQDYANDFSILPNVKYVYLNKTLSTITNGIVPSRLQPDVAVEYINGSYGFIEIVSPSQTIISQVQKIEIMSALLDQYGLKLVLGQVILK